MKNGTKWGIALGVGIPSVLILIGLIGLLIKFFMKRCRKKAWDDIRSAPKDSDSVENGSHYRKLSKRRPSDREPLYESEVNTTTDISDGHISIPIPIDEHDNPSNHHHNYNSIKENDHTLVQIQRERLNRLKLDEIRLKPMISINPGGIDIQRAIDEAQKEFDESVVGTATVKIKHYRHK
ncbi:unnamed protein product [Adineta steineri]|uniref:Uncharacterized protein n=2 Tax=Adineta steineri TaxID=433720 RepID=A0A818VK49_9BILA|nr:unnamed protein product [Adineta steineri]